MNSALELTPTERGYQVSEKECSWNLPLLQGTHICFYFSLT
jgi:hypothetical protein